jgi:glutamine amidotransferase
MSRVAIVYLGLSNVASVHRALEDVGANPFIAYHPSELVTADKILLPGVGSFAQAMQLLKQGHWIEAISLQAVTQKKPLLGICLGMQLLLEQGFEGGEVQGLGYISGSVDHLKRLDCQEAIPHVGWNEVHQQISHPLFHQIPAASDFYFVHSYAVSLTRQQTLLATTDYGIDFTSAIAHENIMGVQFHPEKSGKVGLQLLSNFVRL